MRKFFIKNPDNKLVEVKEIWESFTGWYWYITELNGEDSFGLVDGFEKEWGYISLNELKSLMPKVWRVKKVDYPYTKNIEVVNQ